jgi:hypothetical protein
MELPLLFARFELKHCRVWARLPVVNVRVGGNSELLRVVSVIEAEAPVMDLEGLRPVVMHAVVMRIPKWLWFALALVAGVGAALAFIVYVANGIVAGDLIGVAGREHDIAIAQHRSRVGLLSCIVLQFGVAGALFGVLDREDDHAAPIVWAVLGSFVVTLVCGIALSFTLRIFH